MNTVDNPPLLAAQAAIRAGRPAQARAWLRQAIRQNPGDYRAWLWLGGLTPSPRAALHCIQQAEALNPHAPAVQAARRWAEGRLPPSPAPLVSPPAAYRVDRLVTTTALLATIASILLVAWLLWRPTVRSLAVTAAPQSSIVKVVAAASQPLMATLDSGGAAGSPETAPGAASESSPLNRPVNGQELFAVFQPIIRLPLPQTAAPVEALALLPASEDARPQTRPTQRPSPTATPLPTETPSPTATPLPTDTPVPQTVIQPVGVGPGERWIDVNLSTQTLVAYEGEAAVFTSLISSGTWLHPTVTGQFRIYMRYEAQDMNGYLLGYDYYLPNVPYVMYFYEDYALHGTYWHNNFGTPMSHGCVNLPTPNAEWIFNWSAVGTLVSIHY
ncbi:MAG: L,D-transpeptidase family protein [Chloroflexota bacterium]